jgi:hypothetical protein
MPFSASSKPSPNRQPFVSIFKISPDSPNISANLSISTTSGSIIFHYLISHNIFQRTQKAQRRGGMHRHCLILRKRVRQRKILGANAIEKFPFSQFRAQPKSSFNRFSIILCHFKEAQSCCRRNSKSSPQKRERNRKKNPSGKSVLCLMRSADVSGPGFMLN